MTELPDAVFERWTVELARAEEPGTDAGSDEIVN